MGSVVVVGVVVPEVVGEIAAALKPDSIHLLAARQGGGGVFIAAMLLCRNKDRQSCETTRLTDFVT